MNSPAGMRTSVTPIEFVRVGSGRGGGGGSFSWSASSWQRQTAPKPSSGYVRISYYPSGPTPILMTSQGAAYLPWTHGQVGPAMTTPEWSRTGVTNLQPSALATADQRS